MKHKICFLLVVILQAGCGVELRDRNHQEDMPLSELKVDNEYTLPIPLTQSEQTVLHYDRLVLGPKAQFITQGLNVRIEVKELIADDATIRSFKPDQNAAAGFNGRSGGHLELIVEHASGNLHIVMQGEKGGLGSKGAESDESLRGPKGAQGLCAVFDMLRGGISVVIRRATDGAPGGQGLPGFPGGDGLKGGDTGTALIKISSTEDFELDLQKYPGMGGEGGSGGAGGPGGPGGDPGDAMPGSPGYHPYTFEGPLGPQGPQGPTGKTGSDGYKEKSCVQTNAEPLLCE